MEEKKEYNQLNSTEVSEVDTDRTTDLERNPLSSIEIKFKMMNQPERSLRIAERDLGQKIVADIKKEAFEQELKVTSVRLIY